jgi:hypothetical protein
MTDGGSKIISPGGSALIDIQVATNVLERIDQRARQRIPVLLFGLIAIVAGFAILVVNLDRARREAMIRQQFAETRQKEAERRANELATDLSNAGDAYRAQNMKTLGVLLKVAIIRSEKNAQAASVPVNGPSSEAPKLAPIPLPVLTPQRDILPLNLGSAAAVGPQLVYIQFAGLIDRAKIIALNVALKQAGWRVAGPSGERTGNAAGFNEVRYSNQANRPAAEALANAVTAARIGNRTVTIRQMPEIGNDNLELWISDT